MKKVVLITGASGGLGAALVQSFLESDWQVIAAYRNNPGAVGKDIKPLRLEVRDQDQIREAALQVESNVGHLDALINNAGILEDEILLKMAEEQFDRVLATNLTGVFNVCRSFIPLLQKNGGHIVNIGSYVGRHGSIGQTNYAASKAGLLGLSMSLARELGPSNIRVNSLFPGGLKTNMTANFSEERWKWFNEENVLGRITTPEEVARFATFLCSTHHISGQVFALDSRITSWC